MAISGDTIAVGARRNDDAGSESGSAYVFNRSGATWSEQAKLTASDPAAGDHFGYYIAVEGDTLVAGARFNDDAGTNSGSAYVFTRSGTTWSEQAKLTADDAAAEDMFGIGVSVEGDTVVVGARGHDDDGADSGAAYVFTRSGATWTQADKLTAGDAAAGDMFGGSVDISGGNIVVGALGDDDAGSESGSAYVFEPSDEEPPETTIDSATDGNATPVAADGATFSDSITFAFSGTDNVEVAGFEYSLDGGAFVSGTSGISFGGLSLGSHTFQVRAIDTSDNIDPTPASFTWTILTPEDATDAVISRIDDLALPTGTANSLTGKLEAIIEQLSMEAPQSGGMLGLLNAFVHGVNNRFTQGRLTEAERDSLLADAAFIELGIDLLYL